MTEYRQLMFNAFAKLGEENKAQLMGYYDSLTERFGEERAIDVMHEAFVQLHAANASASADYRNLLSNTAKSIWAALEGIQHKKVTAKPALERYRAAVKKAREEEGRELELEEVGGKMKLGLFQTEETLRNGPIPVLERKRVYRACASEQDSGLALEVW